MLRLALIAVATCAIAAEPDAGLPHAVITTSLGAIEVELFAREAPKTVATFLDLAAGRTPAVAEGKVTIATPFYDGLTFHRVIPGFMIQGGDPQGDGSGGPGFAFADEINAASLGLDRETVLHGEQLNERCSYQGAQFSQLFLAPLLAQRGITTTSPQTEQQAAIQAVLPQLQAVTLQRFYEAIGYRYDPALPPSHPPVRGVLAMANSGPNTNGSQFFINLGDTPHLAGKHTVFGRVVRGMDVVDRIGAVATGPNDRPVEPVRIVSVRAQPAQ